MKRITGFTMALLLLTSALPVSAAESNPLLIQIEGTVIDETVLEDINLNNFTSDIIVLEPERSYQVLMPITFVDQERIAIRAVLTDEADIGENEITLSYSKGTFEEIAGGGTATFLVEENLRTVPYTADLHIYDTDGIYQGTFEAFMVPTRDGQYRSTTFVSLQSADLAPGDYYIGWYIRTLSYGDSADDYEPFESDESTESDNLSDSVATTHSTGTPYVYWAIGIGLGIVVFAVLYIFRKRK